MSETILGNIQVGDTVYRFLSTVPKPMELTVTAVTEERIVCGSWEFSKITGGEIDEYLGWDGYKTGSLIRTFREEN